MKIAIVAMIFSDTTRIGSVRPRALATQWVAMGHHVTVYSAKVPDNLKSDPPQGVNLVELSEFRLDAWNESSWRAIVVKVATLIARFTVGARIRQIRRASQVTGHPDGAVAGDPATDIALMELNKTARLIRDVMSNRVWFNESVSVAKTHASKSEQPDVIFSTFGPFGSLWLGRSLSKQQRRAKWVSDFRDSIEQPGYLPVARAALRRAQRRAIGEPTLVTTVSDGVRLGLERTREKGHPGPPISVFTNGFVERETSSELRATRLAADNVLRIGYTGALYPGRDLSMLFSVLKELTGEAEVEFHYAGNQGAVVEKLAADFSLEDQIHLHGYLNRQETEELQNQMDVLVVLSWNEDDNQGVLTGKFMEYLGLNKPIISIVSGKLPNAELTKIVNCTGVGIACEYVTEQSDREALLSFIRVAVQDLSQSQQVEFKGRKEIIENYSYRTIARALAQRLTDL